MSGTQGYPPPGGGFPAPGTQPHHHLGEPNPVVPGRAAADYLPSARHAERGAQAWRDLRCVRSSSADLYDGAFKYHPVQPQGHGRSSVIVSSVAMLIPVIVTAISSLTRSACRSRASTSDGTQTAEVVGSSAAYGALVLGSMLQWLGMIFVTGMNAHVAAAAAVGRRLSLGEAWGATSGKRWRLVGMTSCLAGCSFLIVGVSWSVSSCCSRSRSTTVGAPSWSASCSGCLRWSAFVFSGSASTTSPVPPLMLEPVGVFAALGRGLGPDPTPFWRTFGIALLTASSPTSPAASSGADRHRRPARHGGGPGGRLRLSSGSRRQPVSSRDLARHWCRRSSLPSPRCSTSTSASARRPTTSS